MMLGEPTRLGPEALPLVSIVVPFFGLSNFILRILTGNPKKELYSVDYRCTVTSQKPKTHAIP